MKIYILLVSLSLIPLKVMAQNDYPMKIAMVSVFVEDTSKAFKYYTEVLGFEEVMYQPENYIAIVKSSMHADGPMLLLEPTEPGGMQIAKEYKKKLYEEGIPVISFGSDDIEKTVDELKTKGVIFKRDLTQTDWGFEAIFDDDNGNYIQLIKID